MKCASRKHKAEAIEILSLPIVNKGVISGPMESRSRSRAASPGARHCWNLDTLLIDAYVSEQNPSRKKELNQQIRANYEKLNERWGSQPAVLKPRKWKIELLRRHHRGSHQGH